MNGLVLLDPEQQRVLTSSQIQAPLPQRCDSGRSAAANPPRTDFTSSSRTTRDDGHSMDTLSQVSVHASLTGSSYAGPRTDFTSSGQGGKISGATYNSSPRTGTARGRRESYPREVSEYPILRRDSDAASYSSDSNQSEAQAKQYAGTSSGLKISVRWILMGVIAGVVLGALLAHFKVSSETARWINLPGDLFLRALQCLVVPYVFCSVAVAIGDIVFVGKVSVVGLQTAKVFVIMWISSVVMGTGVALLFRPFFRQDDTTPSTPTHPVAFTCANNMELAMLPNNTISCVGNETAIAGNVAFLVSDVNKVFATASDSAVAALTLTDQLMGMIIPIASNNIIASMANSELLSIITFAMVLGSIAGRSYFTKTRQTNYVYLTLLQLRNTFFLAMEWVIFLSPGAAISMIAGSFATNQSTIRHFGSMRGCVVATFTACVIQMMILYPAIIFLMTRCNPYSHMKKMARAYIFAFACSSSLATAPVTLACVRKAKVCSQSLANFVISIGVSSNLSGVGFSFPIAVVFLAESSGNSHQLTVLRILGIALLSLLSCSGVPPIPAAGLVTISTIYTTVFGVATVPPTFAYYVTMNFLIDRLITVCDVNDDIMALKVIAENTDETVTQEHLGERE